MDASAQTKLACLLFGDTLDRRARWLSFGTRSTRRRRTGADVIQGGDGSRLPVGGRHGDRHAA